jgi:Predicted glycosyl hydrolase
MPVTHIVQKGDTLDSIANQFNTTKQRLLEDNVLSPYDPLTIGQLLLITYPTQTYIVKDGDSLYSIAKENGVTLMELLQNNPSLADQNYLQVGKELVLSYGAKEKSIQVNGMTYSFIDERVLKKTLPYLTYITVMGYQVDEKGNFNNLDDSTIIKISTDYGVVPLMLISTLTVTGQGSPEVTHAIFNNQELQNTMLDNIITIMSAKGYHGAVFGFQYVLEEDLQKYTDFIVSASKRFKAEGYLSGVVLIPDTFGFIQGKPYQQTYFFR